MHWTLTNGALPLWRPEPAPAGAVIAVTTRVGGVSSPPFDRLNLGRSTDDAPEAVTENRRRVLAGLALEPERLATAGQVHGTRVARVTEPGLVRETDGLVTTTPGLALAVSGADCLPILLSAPGAVAAAHSGWRGTADGMPAAVLTALQEAAGVPAREVRAYLGTGIGPCCYRVGSDVAQRFAAEAVRDVNGHLHVDLALAARRQLEHAGVPPEAIIDPPACTACKPDWCFSHRRDHGRTGRLWGVAAVRA
jgi:polyphenol oxidase